MINIDELLGFGKEQIRVLLDPMLQEKTYFKARTITRELLSKLYGINQIILGYEELVLNWTLKVARTLSDLVNDGILEIYSRNSRGKLYKKKTEKTEE